MNGRVWHLIIAAVIVNGVWSKSVNTQEPKPKVASIAPQMRLGAMDWHVTSVLDAVYSPNGKWLAIIGADGLIRLWDNAAGKERIINTGQEKAAAGSHLAFSPDSAKIAAPVYPDKVMVWDVASGKPQLTIEDTGRPLFSPDGKTIIIGANGRQKEETKSETREAIPSRIALCDSQTGKMIHRFESEPEKIHQMRVSPNNRWLALGFGYSLGVWDLETLKLWDKPGGVKNVYSIAAFAFSPDSKTLTFRRGFTDGYDVFDLASKKVIRSLPAPPNRHERAVADAQGRILTLPGKGSPIDVWNVQAEKKMCELEGLQIPFASNFPLAASPDGKMLVVALDQKAIRLYDLESGKDAWSDAGHRHGIYHMNFSGDGKKLLTSGPGAICLWDLAAKKLERKLQHPRHNVAAALSRDGSQIAGVADGLALVWDAASGKELSRWKVPVVGPPRFRPPVLFDPTGKMLIIHQQDQMSSAWDPTGKHLHRFLGKQGWLRDLAISADGKFLATAGQPGASLFDLTTGKFIRTFDLHLINAEGAAFSPDGKTIGRLFGDATLFDIESGKRLADLRCELWLKSLSFSPDGKMLAVGSGWNNIQRRIGEPTVCLFELATRKERRRYYGHRDEVMRVAFAPSGKTLASASLDNSVLFWSVYQPRGNGPQEPGKLTQADFDALWSELSAADATKAYDAMCQLIACPKTCGYLGAHLLASIDPKQLAGLIAELDSGEFARREKAMSALKRLEWLAKPGLEKVLQTNPSVETSRRAQELIKYFDELDRTDPTPRYLCYLRAIEVLEHFGTPEARTLLQTVAGGTLGPRLATEATGALDRMRGPRQ